MARWGLRRLVALGFVPLVCVGACAERGSSEDARKTTASSAAIVSSELTTDPPVYGPSVAASGPPRVAWNDSVFLAAWIDDRAGPNQVFATRVAPSGQVLDTTGIPIGQSPWSSSELGVASDGTSFVVVWDDYDQSQQLARQLATWVAPDGTVLTPTPFVVASQLDALLSDVVFDGTRHVLVESPAGAGLAIALRTLDASNNVGPLLTVATPDAGHFPTTAGAACVSGQCFFAWAEADSAAKSATVRVARVQDGVPVPNSMADVTTFPTGLLNVQRPGIACTSTGCFVAWCEERQVGKWHVEVVRGTRLAWDGTLSNPSGSDVLVSPPGLKPESYGQPMVAAAVDGFVVIASGARNNLAHVGTDGSVTQLTITTVGGMSGPDLAAGGLGFLATWGNGRAWAQRFDADGTPIDKEGFSLATAANAELNPAVAATPSGYLVSWADSRGSVFGARFDPSGTLLDSPAVSLADPLLAAYDPVSVHDDSGFVIAFTAASGGSAHIRRVSEGLVPLDPTTAFPENVYPDRIALAPLGPKSLAVAWTGRIDSLVLEPSGYFDDAGVTTLSADAGASYPAAAANGSHALVLFAIGAPAAPDAVVEGRRVDENGLPLDATPTVVATGANAPAIAYGAGHYLVAWRGTQDDAIHVRLVDDRLDGLRCAPEQVIAAAAPYGVVIRVTFDGNGFLVVWSPEFSTAAPPAGAFGARVRADGLLLDPNGFQIAPDARAIALASAGNGASLAAYHRYDPDPTFRSDRVGALLVTSGTPSLGTVDLDAGPCSQIADAMSDANDGGDAGDAGDADDAADASVADVDAASVLDATAEAPSPDARPQNDTRGVGVSPYGGCACEQRPAPMTPRALPLFAFVLIGLARLFARLARQDPRPRVSAVTVPRGSPRSHAEEGKV